MNDLDYWTGFRDALEIAMMELKSRGADRIPKLHSSAMDKVEKLKEVIKRTQ